MPVKPLPPSPHPQHLRSQAKDLQRQHASRDPRAAQRLREFHPRFRGLAEDAPVFARALSLSDAQLAIAREYGFASWTRLKAHVEQRPSQDKLRQPRHERIEDAVFRHAVDLIDAGDADALRRHLQEHPGLNRQRVQFEAVNYFREPALLAFVAENPVRRGVMPSNVLDVARVLLETGVDQAALDETLMLVATGAVARTCHQQLPLILLLCSQGADASSALQPAALHGEIAAVHSLIEQGARLSLAVAAAINDEGAFAQLLPAATAAERHLALALAVQYGRVTMVQHLLEAGEDPNRFNPIGSHSHATPLHQAALNGDETMARLLLERGAQLDIRDLLWNSTPADWAQHEGRQAMKLFLRGYDSSRSE